MSRFWDSFFMGFLYVFEYPMILLGRLLGKSNPQQQRAWMALFGLLTWYGLGFVIFVFLSAWGIL